MRITEYLKSHAICLDGGMGTLLQERGLQPGELPERWNITHPDEVRDIHLAYFTAGSNVVCTNTFGANSLKFSDGELDGIIRAAIEIAREAKDGAEGTAPRWIALDIGPTGRMLKPYGDLDFEDAVQIFAKTVRLGAQYGADLIFIETMNDSYETKAAVLAAKENCDLPVFVSNAYGEDGKLMTGASPEAMVAMLEGLGADALGANCSLGPDKLLPIIDRYLARASVPVIMKPNAGMPRIENGRTTYDLSPDGFAESVCLGVSRGVRAYGGCCGTTPDYISAIHRRACQIPVPEITKKNITCISSYTHAVDFGREPVLIGERINPTGKKRFKEALRAGDLNYILNEGIAQQECGVHALDVNVGLPEIDEKAMLCRVCCELQAILDLPLQLDTSNTEAMEAAARRYNGKPMLNSVNGKAESLAAVLPIAKKYGGLLVCLTLDEGGIPASAEGRVEIAKRILCEAEKYGIDKKDLIFDPLALTVSADNNAARETARAVKMIREELLCNTTLGISNVSFGLPMRDSVNSSFFTVCLNSGLSAAIMNPYSTEMLRAYYTYRTLAGLDAGCADFIAFADSISDAGGDKREIKEASVTTLASAIERGLCDEAARLTRELLCERKPLEIIDGEIIPALNTVGVGFENKTVYLPKLLMSAEAARAAFEIIRERIPAGEGNRCRIVLATVKGDIHDIGKNIVKMMLENYGFAVSDLGRDVSPEDIVQETVRLCAPIVGLSALMTTTVPAMADTVRLLRERAPGVRVMVGGAVLTEEYAASIGADAYAKDAMGAVRAAERLFCEIK